MADFSSHLNSTLSPGAQQLTGFLALVKEPHDLLHLLDSPLFVNPSDLFAIVECETRLRGYSGDRTVSLALFFIDLMHDISFRLDTAECEDLLKETFKEVLCATIEHYMTPREHRDRLITALEALRQFGCIELIHYSFERRFCDWRQMIRAARRAKQSRILERSTEYGLLSRGVIVADRVGNMLSHLRHIYCDRAFSFDTFSLE